MSEAPPPFALFARPEGLATLEHDNTINTNLRDNGIGLVPRVLSVDQEARSATLGCGAITALMTIPLGWHIIDDGRRTLVFDADSQVQVNFRLVRADTDDAAPLIEQTLAALAPHAGQAKWITMELAGMKTLAIRGLPIDDGTGGHVLLDQVFIFKPVPGRPATFCEIRSTTDPERIEHVLNMVEAIQASLQFAT